MDDWVSFDHHKEEGENGVKEKERQKCSQIWWLQSRVQCLRRSANMTGVFIYHSLRRALGQRITVAQIVDFNIFDVVSVCYVDTVLELASALGSRGRGFRGRTCSLDSVSERSGDTKLAI